MRRLVTLLALAAMAVASCSATLVVRGTAPAQLNDGTCAAPALSSATSPQMVHAQVLGRGLEDSLTVSPGLPFSFSWTLPAGTYSVRVWASIASRPALAGCDTTASIEAPAAPHKPRLF
jgi:hypothetical protein